LTRRACPACGETALRPWLSVPPSDARADEARYRLDRCDACGSAVTVGRSRSDAESLYAGGMYARPGAAADRLLEPWRRLGENVTLRALGPLEDGTRVLEIGAGDGRLLRLLRAHGCTVAGIEPYAGTSAGEVRRVPLEEADVEARSADLVILWHVLEHFDEPATAVRAAARALAERGRLVVSVPSLDSLQAALGGERWFHLDVPRHAVHFTRRGLTRLLERCGLAVVRIGGLVLDQTLLGMTQTLLNRLTRERNVAFRALKRDLGGVARRDVVVSALAAPAAALLGSLAEAAATVAGRGGVLVVHAERAA
jgi:SAM-dependent methyltransferase